jgi:hypothetical protein
MAKQPLFDVDGDDVPTEPRLRKIPGLVDDTGLAIIRRAVLLRLATLGELEPESHESTGRAIVVMCRDYLVGESARLSKKVGTHVDT